jgi:hypothetical protein
MSLINVRTDFEKFFNHMVQFMTKSLMDPNAATPPDIALFLIVGGEVEILPITVLPDCVVISGKRQDFPAGVTNIPPGVIVQGIIESSHAEAYVTAAQAWSRKNPTKREDTMKDVERGLSSPGFIGRLPADERIEILSFVGRTMDGEQTYSKHFEIKREIHGDDTSKLLDLIEMNVRVPTADDLDPME